MKAKYDTSDIPKQAPERFDFVVPVCMLLLSLIGFAFIYSAQSYNIEDIPITRQFWIRQIVFVILGFCVYFAVAKMDYSVLFEHAHAVYIFCIILLVPLALKEVFGIPIPLVESRYNATRWIDFGILSLQPSEIAKIGTCVMAAAMMARANIGSFREKGIFKTLGKLIFIFLVPILLIFLQPDLGSTLVFFPMLFAMLYISDISRRFFVVTFALFVALIASVSIDIYGYANFLKRENLSARDSASLNSYGNSAWCLPMKDYQRNRILSFVAPDVVDPGGRDVSWNLRQSLISVGSGGLTGKGHAEGTQAKLGYLPSSVAYNDFIFSVIAEESGFVGGCAAIFLMGIIVLFGCLRTAQLARDPFGRYLCVGIGAILMTHIFINVGMTIGVMPITGLPLPMLSYGGTFVLTCCILLGIVQSVYVHRRKIS